MVDPTAEFSLDREDPQPVGAPARSAEPPLPAGGTQHRPFIVGCPGAGDARVHLSVCRSEVLMSLGTSLRRFGR